LFGDAAKIKGKTKILKTARTPMQIAAITCECLLLFINMIPPNLYIFIVSYPL